MAKGKTGLLGLCAFVAMVLNFINWCIQVINNMGWVTIGGSLLGIMSAVASLLLTGVVLVVAYDFASRQTKGWKILYWVLAIITILSILVGLGSNFAK